MYRVSAQTFSPSARFRNSSQNSLLALRMALLSALSASRTSAISTRPCRLLLLSRPSSLRLFRISSFHHRFDLAQMVIFRVCSLSKLTSVVWIHSISSGRSSAVLLSSRVGLLG